MAIGAILGQTFNAGNGIDINARDILAKLSSDADNGITFGSDGGLFVEPAGGKRTCRLVVGTSTAGWTNKDCDYLCDGTADDVEINAAIQALPNNGGEVIILDGIYNITKPIGLNKNNINFKGNGISTEFIRQFNGTDSYTGDGAIIRIPSSSNYCLVSGLYIEGNKTSFNNSANVGIFTDGHNNIVQNTIIKNNSGRGIGEGDAGGQNYFIGNLILDNNSYGIYTGEKSIVIFNVCKNNKYGIGLGGTGAIAVNNIATNNSQIGIEATFASIYYGALISGNDCSNNNTGISVSGSQNIITNNFCVRGKGESSNYTSSQYTIIIPQSFQKKNLVVGNNCSGKAVSDSGTSTIVANNIV